MIWLTERHRGEAANDIPSVPGIRVALAGRVRLLMEDNGDCRKGDGIGGRGGVGGMYTCATGGAITQVVKASGDNKQVVANLDCGKIAAPYRYARFVMTIGTATSDAGVVILGFDPLYAPASDNDLASVVQIAQV